MRNKRLLCLFLCIAVLMSYVVVFAEGATGSNIIISAGSQSLKFSSEKVTVPVMISNKNSVAVTVKTVSVNNKTLDNLNVSISPNGSQIVSVKDVDISDPVKNNLDSLNVSVELANGERADGVINFTYDPSSSAPNNPNDPGKDNNNPQVKPIDPLNLPYIDAPATIQIKGGKTATVNAKIVNPVFGGRLKAEISSDNGSVYVTDVVGNRFSDTYLIYIGSDISAVKGSYALKMTYYYPNGDKQDSTETTIYIKLIEDEVIAGGADVQITKVNFLPSTPFSPGQPFAASVFVKNVSKQNLRNVSVTLENLSGDKISLSNGLNSRKIDYLPAGKEEMILFNLVGANQIASGRYEVGISVNYTDMKFQKGEAKSNFFVDIKRDSGQDSNIIIEKLSYPSGTLGLQATANVSFSIRNIGQSEAKNLVVKASSDDQTGLVAKSVSQTVLPKLAPGESMNFTFSFLSTPVAETKNYPVTISISYEDESTTPDKPKKTEQFVGIFVKNAKKDAEAGPKTTPKLIIDKYSFDPQLVPAGSNFDMHLSFYNTNSEKTVKNIKIFLTSVDKTTGDSTSAGTSVFTPVDSSNTFYIASIPPGGRVEKTIKMYTVPTAAAKTYEITANFEYEDGLANPFTATEIIGVPVIQESKLTVGDIDIPPTASVGEPVNIQANFYNTGKVTLYNMMVKLDGDFPSENGSYYVGNFNPGSSENFQATITPSQEGELKGAVVFSYEDSTGKKHEERHDFAINIEAVPAPDPNVMNPDAGADMDAGSKPIYKKPAAWIGLAVLAGAAAAFFIRRRKKKKQEKEMNLDE